MRCYQDAKIANEVQALRERATVLRCTYIVCLVLRFFFLKAYSFNPLTLELEN